MSAFVTVPWAAYAFAWIAHRPPSRAWATRSIPRSRVGRSGQSSHNQTLLNSPWYSGAFLKNHSTIRSNSLPRR